MIIKTVEILFYLNAILTMLKTIGPWREEVRDDR